MLSFLAQMVQWAPERKKKKPREIYIFRNIQNEHVLIIILNWWPFINLCQLRNKNSQYLWKNVVELFIAGFAFMYSWQCSIVI